MYRQLKEKLWSFIVHNNPDLMFNLQDEYKVTEYLETKVSGVMPKVLKLLEEEKEGHAILELCMNEMTAELKPSRYHYISSIIKGCFPEKYESLREEGQLSYKAVLLVETCKDTFDALNFCEQHIDDPEIKKQIINKVSLFFKQDIQN